MVELLHNNVAVLVEDQLASHIFGLQILSEQVFVDLHCGDMPLVVFHVIRVDLL